MIQEKKKLNKVVALGLNQWNTSWAFGVNDQKITLSHDDIPTMMAKLLSKEKFRKIFSNQFPVVLLMNIKIPIANLWMLLQSIS